MNGTVYNPQSVVFSILSGAFNNYWNQTETYEALKIYIDLNYDGLKNQIIRMMQGDSVSIDIGSFNNDMTSFASRDDVLTLLIHLGYLGYDSQYQEAFIPNNEILNEFANAVRNSDWGEVTKALEEYQGNLLLVGISNDKKTKEHKCKIEELTH